MGTGYRAFISYHHSPVDTPVAAMVQRKLERLRIPAEIRKRQGISSLRPIFRDKEELSVSSDLNEVIREALQSSEYLIVICSTTVRESDWVTREIEFFLTMHDRSRILAVLADGEDPTGVMPEILLSDPDGEGHYEPLACDLRPQNKKAHREEILRLGAALSGASYDGFRRRYQQYRYRRMTAAGSVLLAAAAAAVGYLSWSNAKISDSLRKVKMSSARDLAILSENALGGDDRVEALRYALQALPADGPVVPEAQYALAQALNPYRIPETDGPDLYPEDIAPEYNYHVDSYIEEWQVRETGRGVLLSVVSSDRTVRVWNTEDHSLLYERECGGMIDPVAALTGSGRLLLRLDDRVEAVDLFEEDQGDPWEQDVYLGEEESVVSAVLVLSPEDRLAVVDVNGQLRVFDVGSGSVLHEVPHAGTLSSAVFSADLRYLGLLFTDYEEDYSCDVSVLDLETGTLRSAIRLARSGASPCMAFGADGTLVVTGGLEDRGMSSAASGSKGTMIGVLTASEDDIICIDAATGKTLWTSSNPHWMYPHTGVLYEEQIPDPETGEVTDGFICCSGTEGIILRRSDGALLRHFSMPHSARDVFTRFGGDELEICAVLEDGELAIYWPFDDVMNTSSCMRGNVWQGIRTGDRLFVSCPTESSEKLTLPDQIISYGVSAENPGFLPLRGLTMDGTYLSVYPAADGFIIESGLEDGTFAFADSTGQVRWEVSGEPLDYNSLRLGDVGPFDAWGYLCPPPYGETDLTLFLYDYENGERREETIGNEQEVWADPSVARTASGDVLAGWICRPGQTAGDPDGGEITACIWSAKKNSVHSSSFRLPQGLEEACPAAVSLSPDGETMILLMKDVYTEKVTCCALFFAKGEIKVLSADTADGDSGVFDGYNRFAGYGILWNGEGDRFAFCDERCLSVFSASDGMLWQIGTEQMHGTSFSFVGDDLYLFAEAGKDLTAYRYKADNGAPEGELRLLTYESDVRYPYRSGEYAVSEEDGNILYMSEDGAFVFDPEEMKMVLKVPGVKEYNARTRTWYVLEYSSPENTTGCMRRLTLEEMKEQAAGLLGIEG